MLTNVIYLNFNNRRRGEGKDNHNYEHSKLHTFHSKLTSKEKKYADFKGNKDIEWRMNVCFPDLKNTKNGFNFRIKKGTPIFCKGKKSA